MTQARARFALLVLTAVCAGAMLAPAQASAAYSFFSCTSQTSGVWCDGRGNGSYDGENSWDYVEVWPTSGSFQVCQRVYKPSTGTWLTGDGCWQDWESHYYGDVQCVCYDAQIRQTSGSAQSISGYADSAWTP